MERKNIWLKYDMKEEEALEKLSKEYMSYLDRGKTEREVVKISDLSYISQAGDHDV